MAVLHLRLTKGLLLVPKLKPKLTRLEDIQSAVDHLLLHLLLYRPCLGAGVGGEVDRMSSVSSCHLVVDLGRP